MKKSDLLFGNDSAPRHLAVSQNTPSIAIHGSTGIGAWTPPEPQHIAFSYKAECQPCNSNQCSTSLKCLVRLKPEDIIDDIVTHLEKYRKGQFSKEAEEAGK